MEENNRKGFSIKNIYNILNKRSDSLDSQISVVELQETSPGIWETNILIPLNNSNLLNSNVLNSKSIYKNGIKNLDNTFSSTGSIKSINTHSYTTNTTTTNPLTTTNTTTNPLTTTNTTTNTTKDTNSEKNFNGENLDKNEFGVFIPIFGPYGCNFPPDYRLVQSRYGPSYQCSYPYSYPQDNKRKNFPLYINNQFFKPKRLARWNSIDKDNLYHWDPFNLNHTFTNLNHTFTNLNHTFTNLNHTFTNLNHTFTRNGNFKPKNSQVKREILIYPQ